MKQTKLTAQDALPTGIKGLSSDAHRMGRCTNFLLAKINPDAIGKSWIELRDYARDAQNRTTLVEWVSGTTYSQAYRADATVYIMRNGSVAIFIGSTTSTSNGGG
jgi:hypothetical protein